MQNYSNDLRVLQFHQSSMCGLELHFLSPHIHCTQKGRDASAISNGSHC